MSSHHSKVVEELKTNLSAATHLLQTLEEKERHSSRALEACEVDRMTAVGRLFDLTMKANGQKIYNILLSKYDHEKGATANAFRTWSKFVVNLKAAMERGLFAEGVAGKWMKTMLLRHMMAQWKGYLKTFRLMKRVFARLVSRSLVQAMQKWKAVVGQLAKLAAETQGGFTKVSWLGIVVAVYCEAIDDSVYSLCLLASPARVPTKSQRLKLVRPSSLPDATTIPRSLRS